MIENNQEDEETIIFNKSIAFKIEMANSIDKIIKKKVRNQSAEVSEDLLSNKCLII